MSKACDHRCVVWSVPVRGRLPLQGVQGLGLERHYGLDAAARDVEAWQQHEWRLLSILDADYPDFSYVFPDPAARRRALRQFMVATARDAAIYGHPLTLTMAKEFWVSRSGCRPGPSRRRPGGKPGWPRRCCELRLPRHARSAGI